MTVWLVALGFSVWWIWPNVERGLSQEVVGGAIWLAVGAAAWVVALWMGLERYRPRPPAHLRAVGGASKTRARGRRRAAGIRP